MDEDPGYACPVCETPERDAEHLANHLAFTALLRGGDHESWLDRRVPDWADRDPSGLADAVVDHAEEVDVEVSTGEVDGHDHERAHPTGHAGEGGVPGRDAGALDDEAESVLREARELTARMRGDADAAEDAAESEPDE